VPQGTPIRNLMSIQYCRHIKINGERCGSPALRDERFCYYHIELNRRHRCAPRQDTGLAILHPLSLQDGSQRDPVLTEPTNLFPELELPQLEDRHSIQVALSLIIAALAQNRIHPTRAMQLFYGLQVASSNAYKLNPIPKRYLGKVSLTVPDESTGNLIAPEGDPEDPAETAEYETPGTATKYWNMLKAEDDEKDRLREEAENKAYAEYFALNGHPPLPVPYQQSYETSKVRPKSNPNSCRTLP
jgi:hypothetical protein